MTKVRRRRVRAAVWRFVVAGLVLLLAVAACGDGGSVARIAFVSLRDGNWEVCVMDADGSNITRLTNDPASDSDPAWSPDGTRFAFVSSRLNSEVYVMDADGSNITRLTNDPAADFYPAWSPAP